MENVLKFLKVSENLKKKVTKTKNEKKIKVPIVEINEENDVNKIKDQSFEGKKIIVEKYLKKQESN